MSGQWAPDPWHQAQLRWHDGTQWTAHVANRLPGPPAIGPLQAAPRSMEPDRRRPRSRWVAVGVPVAALFGIGTIASAISSSQPERPELVTASATTVVEQTPVTQPVPVEAPTTVPTESAPGTEPATPAPIEPAPAPETTTTAIPAVASAGPVADPALVQACTEFTPVAAFMGMPKYQELWNLAAQNTDTLRANCSTMSTDELTVIAQDMAAVQSFFEASATTAPPPPPSTAAPPPPPSVPSAVPLPAAAPLPPPPAPATTVAAPSPGCDPNYAGTCVPIDSDVDCGGGKGDGPSYAYGPFQVVGRDIYDLDRDGNGIACE